MRRLLWLLLLFSALSFTLGGCLGPGDDDDDTSASDDDDSATGDDDTGDDDTGDDDTGDDDDSIASSSAPAGQALCAAGGKVSGEGLSGVICLAPVELSSGATASSADGTVTWHPGPITRITP